MTFSSDGDFEGIEPAAGLCLFRIAQEALRNVVTHAEARQVTVLLIRIGDHGEITVADDGRGFDIARVRSGSDGLGLVSIKERARLAGGLLTLVSQIGKGTTLHVRIPLTPGVRGEAAPAPAIQRA